MSPFISGARFQPNNLSKQTKVTASDMAATNFQTIRG